MVHHVQAKSFKRRNTRRMITQFNICFETKEPVLQNNINEYNLWRIFRIPQNTENTSFFSTRPMMIRYYTHGFTASDRPIFGFVSKEL